VETNEQTGAIECFTFPAKAAGNNSNQRYLLF